MFFSSNIALVLIYHHLQTIIYTGDSYLVINL